MPYNTLIHKEPMDYETDISIHQYYSDGHFYYNLKVTDVMNMDYLYMGSAPTLDNVMECIKLHLKHHQK
jgi:hypothetical protein